jgi:hypothetical protein
MNRSSTPPCSPTRLQLQEAASGKALVAAVKGGHSLCTPAAPHGARCQTHLTSWCWICHRRFLQLETSRRCIVALHRGYRTTAKVITKLQTGDTSDGKIEFVPLNLWVWIQSRRRLETQLPGDVLAASGTTRAPPVSLCSVRGVTYRTTADYCKKLESLGANSL